MTRGSHKAPVDEGPVGEELIDDGVEMARVHLDNLLVHFLQIRQIVFLHIVYISSRA